MRDWRVYLPDLKGRVNNIISRKKEEQYVYDRLREYCGEDHYPFHMPGHKRRMGTITDAFAIDITEIDGFDNLHQPQSLLKEAQQRAARLYGADESFFLINGSTAGILSAIGACAHAAAGAPSADAAEHKRIVMARGCHKSVYHAVYQNRLEPVYLYPENESSELCPVQEVCRGFGEEKTAELPSAGGRIAPEAVEQALTAAEHVCAVVITSPTYDGIVSDVRSIARIAHRHGVPLIVDEAHGAHFGFDRAFPDSAVHLGADLVIQSLHKTLPSLTQTALLHVSGFLVDTGLLRRMLGIYQTSSPSYVLMASIDECVRHMERRGCADLAHLAGMLERFYSATEDLEVLRLLRTDDPSRILISGGSSRLSGLQICAILREQYHLELEMAAPAYALALSGLGDDEEGFVRLSDALHSIDRELALQDRFPSHALPDWLAKHAGQTKHGTDCASAMVQTYQAVHQLQPLQHFPLYRAWDMPAVPGKLRECVGKVSAEFVYLYPPGIPLLVPGEEISPALLQTVTELLQKGFTFMGCADERLQRLRVLELSRA